MFDYIQCYRVLLNVVVLPKLKSVIASVVVMLFVIGVDSVVSVGDFSSSITERFTFNDDLLSALIPEAQQKRQKTAATLRMV